MTASKAASVGVAGKFRLVQDARDHLRGAVVAEDVVDAAVGFDGDLFFEHQFAMQASGAAAVQRLIEQGHGAPIARAARGHRVADGHGRQRAEFFFDVTATLFFLFRLGGIGKRRRRPSGNIGEIFFGQRDAFARLARRRESAARRCSARSRF